MKITDVIAKKRDKQKLSAEDLEFFINGLSNGKVADYQASALLMAMYLNGLDATETKLLTELMMHSGDTIDLSAIDGVKVDKHSTGGVGDKTTLIVTPLVASLGIPVAKMTGKGLGHTGGTMDKLNAFRGIHLELSQEEFIKQVQNIGIAVTGQSANLVPADQQLYALRDVTATVDNLSLIAASIMSKKLASGADAIVLDVKVGSGGFNPDIATARKLANMMIQIGKDLGRKTVCVLSSMDQPLGRGVGNAIEVVEAIEILKGKGPKDVLELCLELSAQMVLLSGFKGTKDEVKKALQENINSGKALAKLKEFVENQKGDATGIEDYKKFPQAEFSKDLLAPQSGVIAQLDAKSIGLASMLLGAGRAKKGDTIDLAAGIYLHKKMGESVQKDEPLATLYTNQKNALEEASEKALEAWTFTENEIAVAPIVLEIISA